IFTLAIVNYLLSPILTLNGAKGKPSSLNTQTWGFSPQAYLNSWYSLPSGEIKWMSPFSNQDKAGYKDPSSATNSKPQEPSVLSTTKPGLPFIFNTIVSPL